MKFEEFVSAFKVTRIAFDEGELLKEPKIFTSHEAEILPDIMKLAETLDPVLFMGKRLYVVNFQSASSSSLDVTWAISEGPLGAVEKAVENPVKKL